MTERPIIFLGEMVRAIFEGRKTQTRRVINPQPSDQIFYKYGCWNSVWFSDGWKCPYGTIGGRLWLKNYNKNKYAEREE